jgi:hypothetical protein
MRKTQTGAVARLGEDPSEKHHYSGKMPARAINIIWGNILFPSISKQRCTVAAPVVGNGKTHRLST